MSDFTTNKTNFAKFCIFPALLAGGVALSLWMLIKLRKRQKRTAVKVICERMPVIHIISCVEEWEQCYTELLKEAQHAMVVGLDCEWVLKNPVSLLQISSWSHYCVLVRLNCFDKRTIPQSMKTFLADKSIVKVGVAVKDDAKKLLRDFGMEVNGCIDLRHLMQRVKGIYKCHRWGLQGLAKSVLNVHMSKDFAVRCGNWEVERLTAKQIDYAAKDAMAAVDIFVYLVLAKIIGKDPRLNLSTAAQVDMELFLMAARSLVQGLVGIGFKRNVSGGASPSKVRKANKPSKKDGTAFSTRKRPLWDNCQLLAPDGQHLCTCDTSKAEWYITKQLGDKVSDSPLIVKLRFEPSGRPKDYKRNYYLQEKDNICVVCGNVENYARKFIVPKDYRKYFPMLLKEHTSHDVLLMCPSCHSVSSDHDGSLRQELAVECNAPLNCGENSSVSMDHDLQQVRSAGRALKFNRRKIPAARIQELEKVLYDYYGIPDISDDVVEAAANLDVKQEKSNYVPHAQKVVEYMAERGQLVQFQARWRRHFVHQMQPKFLPAYWTVDYVPENWQDGDADDEKNVRGRGTVD